jgi:hypothetical protein
VWEYLPLEVGEILLGAHLSGLVQFDVTAPGGRDLDLVAVVGVGQSELVQARPVEEVLEVVALPEVRAVEDAADVVVARPGEPGLPRCGVTVALEEGVQVEFAPVDGRVRVTAEEVEGEPARARPDDDELAGDTDEIRVPGRRLRFGDDADPVVGDAGRFAFAAVLPGRPAREGRVTGGEREDALDVERATQLLATLLDRLRERADPVERSVDDPDDACLHVAAHITSPRLRVSRSGGGSWQWTDARQTGDGRIGDGGVALDGTAVRECPS